MLIEDLLTSLPTMVMGIIALFLIWFFGLRGFALIRDNEVGILIKIMKGKPLEKGQIIARDPSYVGVQAEVLMPGLAWRLPIVWRIEKEKIIKIPQDKVGVVEAIDGEPLPMGRLLGDHVPCNNYQDAKTFLLKNGKKGPQVDILRPGDYRINTRLFSVKTEPITDIGAENLGVVIARDGKPFPSEYLIAPEPTSRDHNFFQNGQVFLDNEGYRGPQLQTLQPGKYYINPLLFDIEKHKIVDVPPGFVAVIRSNVGLELSREPVKDDLLLEKPETVHEKEEATLTTNKNQRGIFKEPIAPGKYNLNPLAYTAYLVPTSAVTIDWASSYRGEGRELILDQRQEKKIQIETVHDQEFFRFNQLKITSLDGFQLDVDVRLIIRIPPEFAAYVISRFGSVENLIEQIVHPLIDSSFRNKAGEKKAIAFVQSRTELQREALEKAREEFSSYHIETKSLLIAYIKLDEELLKTQTNKEIALQLQAQYEEEKRAEEQKTVLNNQRAIANMQKDVVGAELGIKIAQNKAQAVMETAQGDAYATQVRGQGQAKAYEYQVRAVGQNNLAALELMEKIRSGNVQIVPQVSVIGSGGNATGDLFGAYIATLLKPKEESSQEPSNPIEEIPGPKEVPETETPKKSLFRSVPSKPEQSENEATTAS